MATSINAAKNILMMAYTYYESDPRVMREAEAAVNEGFNVDFLALRKVGTASSEILNGVRIIRLNQSKYRGGRHHKYLLEYAKFFIRCFAKATCLHFKRWYEIIHVNNMPDFLVFSSIIPKMLGAKIILDIHDPMPDTFISKFKGRKGTFYYKALIWQEKLSAAFSNRLITVHHLVKEQILVGHGISADSIDVVANFADNKLFPLREHYHIGEKVQFVFHGTILERAGLRMLMVALTQVVLKDRIHVRIIGEGDFSDELNKMIRKLGLECLVSFENKSYPAHLIPQLIEPCHVGLVTLEVSPISNYALPLKLLEYISLGLPVITVRNEAILYYFREDDCIFFDWNNPSSLSSTLDHIAKNPRILFQYRERSIALRNRFSWENESSKYVALLNRLLGM